MRVGHTRLGFSHITRWDKIAIVTEKDWVRLSVDLEDVVPGEVKGVTGAEPPDARA